MLLPIVPQTGSFKKLVREVRDERAKTNICPSAKQGIDISGMLMEIIENNVYKSDYESITLRLLEEPVSYETAVDAIKSIAKTGAFDE